MSIFRFFSEGQESEPRVLKAQLALAATTARHTRITAPIWAAACAILCSTGVFGHVSFAYTVFLPLAVTAAMGANVLMATGYQHYNDSEGDVDSWLQCFVMIQTLSSAAWGLMPWLCWEKGNPLNHMFLAAGVMSVVASLVVARGSNMRMYIANLLPLSLMTTARFLLSDSTIDIVMGAAAPLAVFQLWQMGRPLVLRMGEDARLRFKIEDMAGELKATDTAIRNLLDNAEQGFLTINRELAVGAQSSAACQAILGQAPAGKPLVELLCRSQDAASAMGATLASVFQDSSEHIRELKLGLLPAAFELDGKTIKAGYKMLSDDQLMLILTDITETTRLSAQVERERQRLEMIVLAFTESEAFTALVEEYRAFLDAELPSLLQRIAAPGAVGELYRRIHTFKGLLAQFSFSASPQCLHGVETALSEKSNWTAQEAHAAIAPGRIGSEFQRDLDSIADILGPDFFTSGRRLVLSQAQLQAMKHAAEEALDKDVRVSPIVRQLLSDLAGLGGLDVKSALALHGRGATALASRLEKQLTIEIEGGATSLAPEIYGPFLRSLVHVFRNAVDHGIEAPEARLAAGKPADGSIRCSIRNGERGLDITIEDDGHGVERKLLELRLTGHGATSSQAAAMSLEDLVFREGLSSRDVADEISGRGLGLAAVKAEVDRLGGTARVESRPGAGTCFRFHLPIHADVSARSGAAMERIA